MESGRRGTRPKTLGSNFTMRLEPAVRQRIEELAAQEKRPPAHMIRILLDEALATRDASSEKHP